MNRLAGSVILATCFVLTGCDIEGFDGGIREKEEFHYSYDLRSGGSLELESFNGSIEIAGWDKNVVEINGTKEAANRDLLKEIRIDVTSTPDSIRVRTVRPQGRHGGMGVKYVLSVPRKIVLERIASSNGSIRVRDIEGRARLKTSNGSVRAANLKGDIDAGTSNGGVELTDFTGGATLHTSNGSIHATGVRGYLEATTSNGAIDAEVVEAGGRPIRADSSNGRINLTVESLKGSDVQASTSNSSITVRLPSPLNARLKASTSNSSINSEFDLTVRGSVSKNRIDGTIGSGGPLIHLSSSNGAIRIQKL
ncbi:MAG: DUF4097 family beta strand repeat protein [Bryobacterales bacterium]|nr:DUF4097 family beta strand repeat protein [Bryobacterales bacterium]